MTILHEYESVMLTLHRDQAEAFQSTGFVTVTPVSGNLWRVTAGSHVGTIVIGDRTMLIRPKIRPENLFLLLEPGLPPHAWRQSMMNYASSSNLLLAMIAFFTRTVETALGRGLVRSYRERRVPLPALRGRIDLNEIFVRAGLLMPIPSHFDDFTEDILENQILKATIRQVLKVPRVPSEDRQRLMRELVALESVSDFPVRADDIELVQVTRLNAHYGPALRLAGLILSNLSLADAHGGVSATTFMVDMNDLFQRFVTERLRRELRGTLTVLTEPANYFDEQRSIIVKPDLVFKKGNRTVYVGDIKYKVAKGARASSSDYYQMLAYTTALELDGGILIYCRDLDDGNARLATVRHSRKQLVVKTVDLSGRMEEVEAEIRGLAQFVKRSIV